MKRLPAFLIGSIAVCCLFFGDVLARGPGGGGRGGGSRGGSGPSRSAPSRSATSRSPSMSRPTPSRPSSRPTAGATRPSTGSTRPSTVATRPSAGVNRPSAGGTRPGTGTPGGRPSQGQLNNFLDLGGPSKGGNAPGGRPTQLPNTRPSAGGGGAAGDFLQNRPPQGGQLPASERPGQRPGEGRPGQNRPDRVDNRPERRTDLAESRPARIDNRQQWQGNRQIRHVEVRNQVNTRYPNRRNWYNDSFWRTHPHARWHFRAGINWWRPVAWATVTRWVAASWSQPVTYSYGENIYYQDNSVYYGDKAVATAEQYTEQAEKIAASIPEADPDEVEWLPLGVFALTADGQATGTDPTMFLQLAVSKEGIIAGTLQNTATDSVQSIEGMVDKKSQRAAWTVVDKTRPIMETGINNLTEDTAPALVHFDDGQTQQWLLVRLEEPTE